jgi:hypothetical protein
MNISDLKPGQVMFDVHSYKMGNTTVRSLGVWRVKIIEVDVLGTYFMASWNNNGPKKHFSVPSNWKKKEPFLVEGSFGRKRRPTREELAEHHHKLKEKGDQE